MRCVHFMTDILFGCTIEWQTESLDWNPLDYWQRQNLLIMICFYLASGDIQYIYWTQHCIITRRLLNIIFMHVYESLFMFQMIIISLLWTWEIFRLVIFNCNITLYSTISFRLCSVWDILILLLMISGIIYLKIIVIGTQRSNMWMMS